MISYLIYNYMFAVIVLLITRFRMNKKIYYIMIRFLVIYKL